MRPSLRVGQWIDPAVLASADRATNRLWEIRAQALSLYEEAFKEAERHKWIESQKHGRDLGEPALDDWFRRFWPKYCRCKRMEHLQGRQCWQEFDEEHFGQFYRLIVEGDLLLDRIQDRVEFGMENLELINWALEWGLPMGRVLDLLTHIDINRVRIEPTFRLSA